MFYLNSIDKNPKKKPKIIRVSKDLDELKIAAREMKSFNPENKYKIFDSNGNLVYVTE
jgi:hypothetical protein